MGYSQPLTSNLITWSKYCYCYNHKSGMQYYDRSPLKKPKIIGPWNELATNSIDQDNLSKINLG